MSSLSEAKQLAHDWIDQNRQRLSGSIWRSGATPNRHGGNTAPPRRTSTCCATKDSTSKKAAARCRPPSPPPGERAARDRLLRRVRRRPRQLAAVGALPGAARGLPPVRGRAHRPAFHAGCRRARRVPGHEAALEKFGIEGQLRFFGSPRRRSAIETGPRRRGYYDGADAFISYHPMNANTTVWETHCGSYWSAVFTFECAEPEVAGRGCRRRRTTIARPIPTAWRARPAPSTPSV